MSENKAKKLVVTITHNANDDKASVGFTVANAALSTGMQVGVFLTSDGVELGRQASSELTVVRPFKPLRELIMALSCPIGLEVQTLRAEVSRMYARVATEPNGEFHFHRGRSYAVEMLGYSDAELAELPEEATASFAGVANPHAVERVGEGDVVLDIGSGAGMDLLIAARRVGPKGRAIGVDMTPQMIERARSAAARSGLSNVEVREGSAETLPVGDSSVDVVISNGVLNLSPDKMRAFSEIARVLKPGGRLMLGDIVVASELSEAIRRDIDLWTG